MMNAESGLNGIACVEYSHPDPYVNYAADEALQLAVATGALPETVRLWTPEGPTVYIGLSQAIRDEIDLASCWGDEVTIIRRHSGGGAVYSDPGVLNVSFALDPGKHPELKNLKGSYRFISLFLTGILAGLGLEVTLRSTSDLTMQGRKIAGQAQSRKKQCILHQVSLLFGTGPEQMEKYLKLPTRMPEYRAGRSHTKFVTAIGSEYRGSFVSALKAAFQNRTGHYLKEVPVYAEELAARYRDDNWTLERQYEGDAHNSLKIAHG